MDVAPRDHGIQTAYDACLASLDRLGLDYIDLYLIHWPGCQGVKRDDAFNQEARRESWRALERLHNECLVRSIGVSNYTIEHLEQLLSHCSILPSVLQAEYHPLLKQKDLLNFCRKRGIIFEAYSSLGEGRFVDGRVKIPILESLASKYKCQPSTILLAWALRTGSKIIPKSHSQTHLIQNFEAVPKLANILQDDDVKALNDQEDLIGTCRFCWDPTAVL